MDGIEHALESTRKKPRRESRRLTFILYRALYGPVVFVRIVYRQLLLLFAMFVWGAATFAYYEHLPVLDAFLASVSTITTIGLYVPNGGNFTTLNRIEAVLLISMILVSVGAGASILQSTVGAAMSGELAKGEASRKLMKSLKSHVIIFGYDHLGKYVAEKLDELGFDYIVVTKDPHAYDELIRNNKFAVHEYESRPMDSLKAAGIDQAMMVVVSHASDSDNMLIILSARKLKPEVRIVSVVHDSSLIETAKNAGADVVVPSSVTVGHLLALSAVTKDLVGIVFSEKIGTKEIAQFSVFKGSPLIGKEMQEVARLAMVIGVIRKGSVIRNIFEPSFRLEEDDTVLVLGDPANLLQLEREARAT